jgi:hypothetical protein
LHDAVIGSQYCADEHTLATLEPVPSALQTRTSFPAQNADPGVHAMFEQTPPTQ